MSKLYLWFCSLFLFTMLFFPRTYTSYKAIMLGLIILGIIYLIQFIQLKKFVLMWVIAFILYYSVWIVLGSFNGAGGTIDYFRVNVIWVILYTLLISVINESFLNTIFKVMIVSNFLICVHVFLSFLSGLGIIDQSILTILDTGTNIGIHVGYSQITSHHIGTLFFTAPFVIILSVYEFYGLKNSRISHKERRSFIFIIINALSSIMIIFISGRRALLFSVAVSLLLFICFLLVQGITRVKIKRKYSFRSYVKIFATPIILLSVVFLVLNVYKSFKPDWDISLYLERINSAITLKGENIRSEQLTSFNENISEKPFVGTGFGIGLPDILRDPQRPWIYEYSYHVIAYNTGIIGLGIYFSLISILLIRFSKVNFLIYKYKIAIFFGFLSFMIGNYSNPYLQSFDFMWVLFLPLLVINIDTDKKV